MAENSLIDTQDICRGCGERFFDDKDEMLDIFESRPLNSNFTYAQLFKMCALGDPKEDDGLSRKLGTACAQILANHFKYLETISGLATKVRNAQRANPSTKMQVISEIAGSMLKLDVRDNNEINIVDETHHKNLSRG